MPASALGFLKPAAGRRAASGHLREQARRATLVLQLITAADIAVHRSFIAQIQFALDTLGFDMNATDKLPNHAIAMVKCTGGSSPTYTPEAGTFSTSLTADIEFSVKAAAWAALET